MAEKGLVVRMGEDLTLIRASCQHQSGMIYVVPAERSWVCGQELRPAHALAGFFRELTSLKDPRVKELMQTWGIYFRELPLEGEPPGAAVEGETGGS
ncbi:MAG: hypothetical protein FJ316_01050 [SAR202 cluster bacterium]|nr:hypothetical protein [SAR202 cluster bacterium]